MPEPFKNKFNPAQIAAMGDALAAAGSFDTQRFVEAATANLDTLEMMERAAQISVALDATLPDAFPDALQHLQAALHPDTNPDQDSQDVPQTAEGLCGWSLVPIGQYVARHGLGAPEASLAFLREATMRFSSEFAIRPFFRDHFDLTYATAMEWTEDPNRHVRRLASEGSRPRLPWGLRLNALVKDPAPLVPLLTRLRDDPTEYVRRSVANNLNDIAKDHPDRVAALAADWLPGPKPRQRLVKHACRSLIKAGHPAALAVFGYGAVAVDAELSVAPDPITLGDTLDLTLSLTSTREAPQNLLIDIALHFRKANGSLAPKVFKWTETSLPASGAVQLTKSLPLKSVTTRRHYPGQQEAVILINGREEARVSFTLQVPDTA